MAAFRAGGVSHISNVSNVLVWKLPAWLMLLGVNAHVDSSSPPQGIISRRAHRSITHFFLSSPSFIPITFFHHRHLLSFSLPRPLSPHRHLIFPSPSCQSCGAGRNHGSFPGSHRHRLRLWSQVSSAPSLLVSLTANSLTLFIKASPRRPCRNVTETRWDSSFPISWHQP